ncbi:hypothetical protein C8R44DRAFT_145926 [Mycena epipterygia]|nr:hypothetical protein C8R44DRAFT_145926 [Mycena epipterygia]
MLRRIQAYPGYLLRANVYPHLENIAVFSRYTLIVWTEEGHCAHRPRRDRLKYISPYAPCGALGSGCGGVAWVWCRIAEMNIEVCIYSLLIYFWSALGNLCRKTCPTIQFYSAHRFAPV